MAKRKKNGSEDRRPAAQGPPYHSDFLQALGETFAEYVSPPVAFEHATPQECCEVVCAVAGDDVTPVRLAKLSEAEVAAIAREFAEFFECKAPSARKIKTAIKQTLARWPAGSFGEKA
jgi:hypothetical protein